MAASMQTLARGAQVVRLSAATSPLQSQVRIGDRRFSIGPSLPLIAPWGLFSFFLTESHVAREQILAFPEVCRALVPGAGTAARASCGQSSWEPRQCSRELVCTMHSVSDPPDNYFWFAKWESWSGRLVREHCGHPRLPLCLVWSCLRALRRDQTWTEYQTSLVWSGLVGRIFRRLATLRERRCLCCP